MSSTKPFDARLYHVALCLYPPVFRREFSEELVRDFDEARQEAHRARCLWAFRAMIGADLARSIARQWLHSGWPVILIGAVAAPLALASSLARLWQPRLIPIAADNPDAEGIALALLAVVVLLVIASTIIFTQCFAAPRPHRRRR